jgi:death-on-curing family protein
MGKIRGIKMVWIPTKEYIISIYEEYIEKPAPLMHNEGLRGTLDKIRWGLPYKKKLSILDQVAILYKELVENHYFADGNKRIGILMAYIFLGKNGITFKPPKGEVYAVTIKVAQMKAKYDEIKKWFKQYSSKKNKKQTEK